MPLVLPEHPGNRSCQASIRDEAVQIERRIAGLWSTVVVRQGPAAVNGSPPVGARSVNAGRQGGPSRTTIILTELEVRASYGERYAAGSARTLACDSSPTTFTISSAESIPVLNINVSARRSISGR